MSTVVGITILIVVIIIVMIIIQSNRKKKKEEKFQAIRKMREDNLKEALSNTMEEKTQISLSVPHRPYEIEYSTGENQKAKEKQPLLQIIEKNKMVEKKYIFRANETVSLGIQFGAIGVLNTLEDGEVWCEIFFKKGTYCIRSFEKSNIYLQRNKKTAIVDKIGVKLKSGDIIVLQEIRLQIFYIKV